MFDNDDNDDGGTINSFVVGIHVERGDRADFIDAMAALTASIVNEMEKEGFGLSTGVWRVAFKVATKEDFVEDIANADGGVMTEEGSDFLFGKGES